MNRPNLLTAVALAVILACSAVIATAHKPASAAGASRLRHAPDSTLLKSQGGPIDSVGPTHRAYQQ